MKQEQSDSETHLVADESATSRKGVTASTADEEKLATSIVSKVYWGLLPWMFVSGIFSYFDRANFAFAAPSLRHDLGLSNQSYGLASGEVLSELRLNNLCRINASTLQICCCNACRNQSATLSDTLCRNPVCWVCCPCGAIQSCDILGGCQGLAASAGHHLGRCGCCASSCERGQGSDRPEILSGGCRSRLSPSLACMACVLLSECCREARQGVWLWKAE